MSDNTQTYEASDDATIEKLRRLTDAERFALGNRIFCIARDCIREETRVAHPDWSDDEVQRETARRISLADLSDDIREKISVRNLLADV